MKSQSDKYGLALLKTDSSIENKILTIDKYNSKLKII